MMTMNTILGKMYYLLVGTIIFIMIGCTSAPAMPTSSTIHCSILDQVASSSLGFRMSIQNQPFAVGTLNTAYGTRDVIASGSGTRQGNAVTIYLFEKHFSSTEEQVAVTLADTKSSQSTAYRVTNCTQHAASTLILSGAIPTPFVVNLDLPH